MIQRFVTWVSGFFNEGQSSTRLIMLAGTLVVLFVWTGLSIYHLALQDIPTSVLGFVAMCLGLKGWSKVMDSRVEQTKISVESSKATVESKGTSGIV